MPPVDSKHYQQVSESIRSVYELATRIDERVANLMRRYDELDKRIESPISLTQQLATRVSVMESKSNVALEDDVNELTVAVRKLELSVQELKGDSSRSNDRTKQIVSFVVQLLWVVIAAYLLYKLHLSPPP